MMRAIMFIAACLLVSGCDRDVVVLQPQVPDVELTVKASPLTGSPLVPVTITADVTNHGRVPRFCSAGCDYPVPGMNIQFYDPLFNPVYLWNPLLRPKCLDYPRLFFPREKIRGDFTFGGILFESNGDSLVMQAGTYTAIISFRSWLDRNSSEADVIEKRVTFQWSSQE